MGITCQWVPESREKELNDVIRREILSKVENRDLGESVDFLRKAALDEASLLEAFWKQLSGPLSDFGVKCLTLKRDSESSTTIWPESSL